MTVINHHTNDKCHMKFDPYSYFGGTPKKVTGTIVSNKDKVSIRIRDNKFGRRTELSPTRHEISGGVRDKRDVGLQDRGFASDRRDGGEGQEQHRDRPHQDSLEGEVIRMFQYPYCKWLK